MPDDFLATSTTLVQSFLSFALYEENSRVCVNTSDSSNPFAFTSEDLGRLFEPSLKNWSFLEENEGTDGLIKGLHSDSQAGLNSELEPIGDFGDEDDEQNPVEGSPFYQRIKVFGKNSLPEKKSKFIFELMWMAIQEKSLILLIMAAFFSLVLGLYRDIGVKEVNQTKIHWIEGVAIIITVLIVVLIGSLNDWQKERQFHKLNTNKEDRKIKANRNGRKTLISVHDILVGDVLDLEPGDVTAADGVLISGFNLHCDESAATGESDAVKKLKYEDCLKEENDDDDVAYHHKADPFIISGSKVTEGVGTYLVTGIGVNSFYGKIMMSLKTEPEDGPLQKKLNDFAEKIAKLGSSVSLLMFIILLIKYFISFRNGIPAVIEIFDDLIRIVISTITLVIVAVPEEIYTSSAAYHIKLTKFALTYSTTRMLEDGIIVRVLSACEKMSYITTICSDKTGTLTQNKMAVVTGTIGLSFSFFRNRNDYSSALKKDSTGIKVLLEDINQKLPEDILQLLKESIAINSTAFETSEDGKRTFVGSKTETALLEFLSDLNLDDIKLLKGNAEIVKLFTFNSERKSMGTFVKIEDSKWRFFVKGASEIILKRSVKIINIVKSDDNIITDNIIDLTQDHFVKVQNAINNYAGQSLRTIGIAYRDFEKSQVEEMVKNSEGEISYEDLFDKLTLLSIVGIEDQLREGVHKAVEMCIKAGVKVRMVTGDNIYTAKSIATQCGIYTGGEVMEGPVFRKLSPEQMDRILPKLQILARCSPEDKKLLVGHLKKLGDVVAVTGDGTNDGPALKLSDVGYSMGITGTEVAKEASSIILADDNFSRIIISILWGRNINEAIKKFLQFQLTVNITAVLLTFITSILGDPILTPVQLLWINLIMDTFASLALSTDPAKDLLLDKKPESRHYAPLISIDMWKMIIGQSICQLVITLGLFFAYKADKPSFAKLAQKNTFIFNTFIFLQIFNEINCRKLDNKKNIFEGVLANKFLMIIFVIMVVGQFLIVQFGGAAFQVEPLSIKEWVVSVILGFLSIPIGFLIRLIPTDHHHTTPPPADNIDLWNDAVTEVQNQLHFFKTLRGGRFRANFGDRKDKSETRSKAIAAAAMLPSLISASVAIHVIQDIGDNDSNVDSINSIMN
ncbi:13734_t:CDS:2 [Rhizophagus irregularis]|nr:13734_t:CDS:2 [Rhizophagus irregularis]